MRWKYDNVMQEYQLIDSNSKLARIQVTPRKKGGFLVKSLVSYIYYGYRVQKKMEKQNKEWVAYRKKLATREEVQKYIDRKKEDIKRFISARENEA